jgi:hypothetical protein
MLVPSKNIEKQPDWYFDYCCVATVATVITKEYVDLTEAAHEKRYTKTPDNFILSR